jgi:hypothetical protein
VESFLNYLWLSFAITGVVLWCVSWTRAFGTHHRPRDPFREAAAIVCALVILFFAVSLTDDLHSEIVFMEDSVAARRHASSLNASPTRPYSAGLGAHSLTGLAARSALVGEPRFVASLLSDLYLAPALRPVPALGDRAPPVASL